MNEDQRTGNNRPLNELISENSPTWALHDMYAFSVGDLIRIESGEYAGKHLKIIKVEQTTLTVRNFKWYDYISAYLYRLWWKVQEKWTDIKKWWYGDH